MKRCGNNCYSVSYCSKECSVAHYKTHKPECKRRREALVRINVEDTKAG